MNMWAKLRSWGLAGLMVFNIAALGYYLVLQKRLDEVKEPPVSAVGGRFPTFSGVAITGAKWEAADAPCRIVRVTSDNCPYCDSDRSSYETFVAAARLASCEIVEVSPKAGNMTLDPRPGIVQLKFVDADLGPVLAPFVTPQTIILDRNWTLQWTRRGMFDEKSLASSVALLHTFAAQ